MSAARLARSADRARFCLSPSELKTIAIVGLPTSSAVRYWDTARQRYYRPPSPGGRAPRVSADHARPGPHTRGKPRLLDVGRRIPARDRFALDSPLEGRVTSELVSELKFRSSQKIRFSEVLG